MWHPLQKRSQEVALGIAESAGLEEGLGSRDKSSEPSASLER
jgi:hypothetical protein